MNGFDLFFDQVKERIDPKQEADDFQVKPVQAVLLLNMKNFMTEDLLSFFRMELDIPVPEQPAEK